MDDAIVSELRKEGIYNVIFVANLPSKNIYLSAAMNLLSTKSLHAERIFHRDIEMKLLSVLKDRHYDIILVESVFMMPYLLQFQHSESTKVVIRAHNVEHLIWERYAGSRRALLKRYLLNQSLRLKRFEKKMYQKVNGILYMSHDDQKLSEQRLEQKVPSMIAPIGMNERQSDERSPEDRPLILGFIGSLDWRPNEEGLMWFFDHIWEAVQEQEFESVLMIAGSNPRQSKVWRRQPKVTFLGEIDDSEEFLSRIDICIVPLLSGSGTRVKILQAFSNGTPVISTSIGAEGLEITNGENIFIADSTEEWINAVSRFVVDHSIRTSMANNAKKYLRKHHHSDKIGHSVLSFFQKPVRHRVVILTSRFPYPLVKGDQLRIFQQIKVLSQVFELFVICVNESMPDEDHFAALRPYCTNITVHLLPEKKRRFQFDKVPGMQYAVTDQVLL